MRQLSYADAINEALRQAMQEDERVVLLGEDIGTFGGIFQVTKGLQNEFGAERVVDTPISEAGFVGACIGAALTGMRPVAELMFIDFSTACMDAIFNQMAKIHYMFGGQGNVPMVLRMNVGAGRCAAAQHSQSFHSIFMHMPGLIVVTPSTPYDAKGLMLEAIRSNNPVIFVEHKKQYIEKGHVPEEPYYIPFGQAEIKRTGSDVTIVATHAMVTRSLKAAEELAKDGIDVEIVDPRTLTPLDKETIFTSVKKTGRLIIADEDYKTCGIGAEIAALAAEEIIFDLKAPVARVTSPDTPVPFSPVLEQEYVPEVKHIIPAVKKLMQFA